MSGVFAFQIIGEWNPSHQFPQGSGLAHLIQRRFIDQQRDKILPQRSYDQQRQTCQNRLAQGKVRFQKIRQPAVADDASGKPDADNGNQA